MKRIFSIIMQNRALAYPRALLPSGGPLSREFWQLTTPLKKMLLYQITFPFYYLDLIEVFLLNFVVEFHLWE